MADKKKTAEEELGITDEADLGITDAADERSTIDKIKDAAAKGLQYGVRGLGFFEGAVGRPLANTVFFPGKNLDRPGESRAKQLSFQEDFPSAEEDLKRAGVEEGKKLSERFPNLFDYTNMGGDDNWYRPNKGGILDMSDRQLKGIAYSMARDPLTYLGFDKAKAGLKYAAEKLMSPQMLAKAAETGAGKAALTTAKVIANPSTAVAATGKSFFKRGNKEVLEALLEKGKNVGDSVDTLIEHAPGPTAEIQRSQLRAAATKLRNQQLKMLEEGTKAGAVVSRSEAWKPVKDAIDLAVKEERISPDAGKKLLEAITEPTVKVSDPTPLIANKWKTDLRKRLPKSVWDELGATGLKSDLYKAAGSGWQQAIENATERSLGAGSGKALQDTNKALGIVLEARRPVRSLVKNEANKQLLNIGGDLAALGTGYASGNPFKGLEFLLAKRLGQLAVTRQGMKTMGKGLYSLGANPWAKSSSRAARIAGETMPTLIDVTTKQLGKGPGQQLSTPNELTEEEALGIK